LYIDSIPGLRFSRARLTTASILRSRVSVCLACTTHAAYIDLADTGNAEKCCHAAGTALNARLRSLGTGTTSREV
jgi:hypothetical protein